MKKRPQYCQIIVLIFALIISFSCRTEAESDGDVYSMPGQANDGWKTASLDQVGMDKAPLVRLVKDLKSFEDNYVHGIVIIKNGKLVFEEYFPGSQVEPEDLKTGNVSFKNHDFDRDTLHLTASVSKSVTSILIGIAIDKGMIKGVDEKLYSFFPEYSQLSSKEKDGITIAHALTMASGLPWKEGSHYDDPKNNWTEMFFHKDPIGYILGKSPVAPPATKFIYSSGTTSLLGDIVRRTSGQTLSDFAESHLFSPLGISTYEWTKFLNAQEVTVASSTLYLRPRDMAKIGQLYLQEGMWDGKQVVSAEWVKESVKESIRILPEESPFPSVSGAYGYQWWLGTYRTGETEAYFAAGFGGQFIIVMPALDMVVVLTGGNWGKAELTFQIKTLLDEYILPAAIG